MTQNNDNAARPRRTKPARVRVEELMDAAQSLFLEQGFDATTIDEVVIRAGVAKGTFYHYFASKNAVLDALRERFKRHFLARAQAEAERGGEDWPARLAGWVRGSVLTYLETYRLHDLVFHASHPPIDREGTDLEPVLAPLRELLEQGARAGAWEPGAARLMAVVIYSAIHGVVDDAIARGELAGGEALADVLTQRFLRALG